MIDIAIGKSRKETAWKNTQMSWEDLLSRLGETHYTTETHAEYMLMKKPLQDERKDIGGFVGGFLTGGRRKARNVLHRQLITLDIDYGKSDIWDYFSMVYGEAACVYSTHKHTPENPRLRLIMPLDREVKPDEYEAIARKIAGNLDIEIFDATTFEPSRLMYWPSTSKDSEFVFRKQGGPWLCADAVLAEYKDWHDTSQWPISEKVNKERIASIKHQKDPATKAGMIGAFCKTYGVSEAIEKYLDDVYEFCFDDRYTYKLGSTSGGLIIYEDKFAYSHHGTDPIGGKLCNAFDLVRIHKFGLKDRETPDTLKEFDLPSFKAMLDFVASDSEVKKFTVSERLAEAKQDFEGEADEAEEVDNLQWSKELEVDKKNTPISSINNLYLVIKNDPLLKNAFFYDEFEARLMARKNLPWRKVKHLTRDFSDLDFDCLAHYVEKCYKMPFTHLQKALSKIMTDYQVHPIREYLSKLTWDGKKRLETMFIDYLGAEDSPYVRSATRKTFIAAITRIFEPGIKFDTVLTLVGKQGVGKSTIIARMGKDWFSDCLGDIHKKDGMESVRGMWLMEIAEMASFKKADYEAIKRFITSTIDIYRPSYGKHIIRFPRQCILFGTTNKLDFLSDPTGDRRFLPIQASITTPTKDIFKDLTTKEVDHLWSEALHYYKAGEGIDLAQEIKDVAERVRESHTIVDDRAGLIGAYLDTLLPENWYDLGLGERREYLSGDGLISEENAGTEPRMHICVAEIWCELFKGFQKDMTTHNTKYIHDILRKKKNWTFAPVLKRHKIYGIQRYYERTKSVNTKKSLVFTTDNSVTNFVNTVNTNVNTN